MSIITGPPEASITANTLNVLISDWRMREFALGMQILATDCSGLTTTKTVNVLFVQPIVISVPSTITLDPKTNFVYQVQVTSNHFHEDIVWSISSSTLTGISIDSRGLITYSPPHKYFFVSASVTISMYDILTGNVPATASTFTFTLQMASAINWSPEVYLTGNAYDSGISSSTSYTSSTKFNAYDPEGGVLTFGLNVVDSTRIHNMALSCNVVTNGYTIPSTTRTVNLYVCSVIWNPVDIVFTSGQIEIWFQDSSNAKTFAYFVIDDIQWPSVITIPLDSSTSCPSTASLRTQWNCQIIPQTTNEIPLSSMTLSFSLTSVVENPVGSCITTGTGAIQSLGKGYFRWQAEGKGCSSLNYKILISVTLFNGQTVSASYTRSLTLTDVNYPPLILSAPKMVTLNEAANNIYPYTFTLKDLEGDTLSLTSCTFDSGNEIPEFSYSGYQVFALVGNTIVSDGTSSTISFRSDLTNSVSFSGPITCTITETRSSPNSIQLRFSICVKPSCFSSPFVYKVQFISVVGNECALNNAYTVTGCLQTGTSNSISFTIYGINFKNPILYFGEVPINGGIVTTSNGLSQFTVTVGNFGTESVDLIVYNNCAITDTDPMCFKYSIAKTAAITYVSFTRKTTLPANTFQHLRAGELFQWIRIDFTDSIFSQRDKCFIGNGINVEGAVIYFVDSTGAKTKWCLFPTLKATSTSTFQQVTLIVYDAKNKVTTCSTCPNLYLYFVDFTPPADLKGHYIGGYRLYFHLWQILSQIDVNDINTLLANYPRLYIQFGNYFDNVPFDPVTYIAAFTVPYIDANAYSMTTINGVNRLRIDVRFAFSAYSFASAALNYFYYDFDCPLGSNKACFTNYPQDCPKGHYCNAVRYYNSVPLLCQQGYYQDVKNQAGCKPCTIGNVCDDPGLIQPKPCPNGWICNTTALAVLKFECPLGFYCLSSTLYECPALMYCNGRVGSATLVTNNLFTPQNCYTGFTCIGRENFIWGIGRCNPGKYCPVTADTTFGCVLTSCPCPLFSSLIQR